MGLFGNKDEINVKLLAGQIKSVCGRSFMGGSSLDTYVEGDTCRVEARYLLSNRICEALGAMDAVVIVEVTRYGTFTATLCCWDYVSMEKQRAFPQIQATMEAKGDSVYYREVNDDKSSAYITITRDGSSKATWKEDLTKFLNDIAVNALRPLSML